MARFAILQAFLAFVVASGAHPAVALTTVAERSGFRTTGRYDEVVALCGAFQKAYPKAVRCVEFGRTPEGRPMVALIASRTGALSADAARRRGIPVLLIQGGIHAGEIDGKDAGFLALRELLEGRAAAGALHAAGAGVRAGVQRRRPRALRPLEPAEPARPRGDGLADHRPELQPEPRLCEGRRARDAGDAAPRRRVGSAGLHRSARHRRRQVRARRCHSGRAAARRRPRAAGGRPGPARRA